MTIGLFHCAITTHKLYPTPCFVTYRITGKFRSNTFLQNSQIHYDSRNFSPADIGIGQATQFAVNSSTDVHHCSCQSSEISLGGKATLVVLSLVNHIPVH